MILSISAIGTSILREYAMLLANKIDIMDPMM